MREPTWTVSLDKRYHGLLDSGQSVYTDRLERSPVMAKVSRETASHVEDIGVLESRSEEVDGTTIEFTSFREDADATPFFEGLPDGRCQSRHWGYVLQGRMTFRYADRDEIYEAGDAYYAPPGHIPVVTAGTELVEFSPTDEYAKTQAVLARNLAAAQAG